MGNVRNEQGKVLGRKRGGRRVEILCKKNKFREFPALPGFVGYFASSFSTQFSPSGPRGQFMTLAKFVLCSLRSGPQGWMLFCHSIVAPSTSTSTSIVEQSLLVAFAETLGRDGNFVFYFPSLSLSNCFLFPSFWQFFSALSRTFQGCNIRNNCFDCKR